MICFGVGPTIIMYGCLFSFFIACAIGSPAFIEGKTRKNVINVLKKANENELPCRKLQVFRSNQ